MHEPPGPAFASYCEMAARACAEKAREKDLKFLYLKYLLAAFTMFILEEPAHPVGTPFPGGQIVDEWEGTCLCPVRELSGDVLYALTALQSRARSRLTRRCGTAGKNSAGGSVLRTTGPATRAERDWIGD